MYKTKSKLDDLVEMNKDLDLAYVKNRSRRNMMTWYNIIQYYVPNNRWMMPMLNLMSGGPWEMVKVQFQEKMQKHLATHKRDEATYRRHLSAFKKAFSDFISRNPNNIKPSSPI
jgi:hypothetical protein